MEGYEIVHALIRPAYSYVEGDKREHWWLDSQNCWYHLICEETDEETNQRFDGKKYWIIEPYKPIGIKITEENYEDIKHLIKWLVTDTSEESDVEKEWDFEKHCIKDDPRTD